ncbi:MAG TPA: ATP-binding protein [Anaerohalosphaeraceae bacterium]|jgi:two-component system NtrC family sensor kinase|nr:ATP-binding protein [Anaerohalosphaeraceae bacterium]HRT49832.1 ATP-binding protein [Anaerohalosphaeraceae bacterium]HRT87051.1 ATP-binding protein [Anaerohalosphaeraceae bacterium]
MAKARQHSEKLALRERIKELTCLYGIAQVSNCPEMSLDDILQRIVEMLPAAWQYPEVASAQITLDESVYRTARFCETGQKQSAIITVAGRPRGTVEILYAAPKQDVHEGPFLREERNLIEEVSRQIGLIVERRQTQQDKLDLCAQVRHAERLATIGILAAGIAHELNEPLANILGFAQLAKKCPGVPAAAINDIEQIEAASLHAREIIRKLLVFARQRAPQKTMVNLNTVVNDSLYLLEARCVKEGITLTRQLAPDLPEITADAAQLSQVVVNLVVNALQSMCGEGNITVQTYARDGWVRLIVKDTGIGMSKDVIEKLFVPFFTTKDVGQGTGLGLPVVHGIVTAHNGSIEVKSKPGAGSCFEIRLPIGTP